MHGLQPEEVQFSESDFRQYNQAGHQELIASLVAARQKAEAAASVGEKQVAQVHLESVEQLWRLSLQLAKERFEHARDIAYKEVCAAGNQLRRSGSAIRRQELQVTLEQAVTAFRRKDFLGAQELAGRVRHALKGAMPELRLVPAVRQASASTLAPEPDVIELLEKALEYERSNRMSQAYRMYLRVLERQPGNQGARQRLRVVREQTGGRA